MTKRLFSKLTCTFKLQVVHEEFMVLACTQGKLMKLNESCSWQLTPGEMGIYFSILKRKCQKSLKFQAVSRESFKL